MSDRFIVVQAPNGVVFGHRVAGNVLDGSQTQAAKLAAAGHCLQQIRYYQDALYMTSEWTYRDSRTGKELEQP